MRANKHDLLAVFHGRFFNPFEPDVSLDELNRAIGARSYRLRGSACEPVDHRAARNQAQHKRSMEQRQTVDCCSIGQLVGQHHDDREDHRRGPDHRGADQYRLGRRLEGVACAIILFQQVLGAGEVDVHVEVFLDLRFDVWHLLNQ